MAPAPVITLYQGGGPGTPGVALIGTIGAGVVHCAANTPVGVQRWRWSWVGAPPSSAIVRAAGVQDSKTLTTYSFTPDLAGGYLLQLDEYNASGAVGTAYLMFLVRNGVGRAAHIPAMRAFPGFPVPDPFVCMNFTGQTPGWGDYQEEYWLAIDALGGGGTIIVQDHGTPLTNTPHSALNLTGDGVSGTDAGAGVATIAIPGGMGSAQLASSGPVAALAAHMLFIDLTGGTVAVTPPTIAASRAWGVKDRRYLAGASAYISIANASHAIEDPNKPGTWTTDPIKLQVPGSCVTWQSPDGTTWDLV